MMMQFAQAEVIQSLIEVGDRASHRTIPSARIFRNKGEFSVSNRERGMKSLEIRRLRSRHSRAIN
jgi:hypothetical protein